MAWAVLLCLCSWWRWCRGSRLWSLFLFSFLSLLLLSVSKISPPSSCLPLSVRLPFSLFLQKKIFAPSLCFFPSVSASLSLSKISPPVCSSPSQKNRPPCFCALPCIYRQPGERHHTMSKCRAWWRGMAPVQPLQGMVFFSSWWGVWVVSWFCGQVGGERRRG